MATQMDTENRSLADLIRELRDESTVLLRQEVALAKTEMSEKASKIGRNVGYLVAGGGVAFLALIFLLLAATAAIDLAIAQTGLAPHGDWLAPLIVGVVVAIVAAAMISKAKRTLQHASLTPEKTVDTLQKDKQWAQAKVQ